VYIKQIGNLLENIQLVDPTAIMHAAVETDNSKPIDKKKDMNANMTIFLAHAPVGKDRNGSSQKRITRRRRGEEARMNLTPLTPACILRWSSCRMWTQRPSFPKRRMNSDVRVGSTFVKSNCNAWRQLPHLSSIISTPSMILLHSAGNLLTYLKRHIKTWRATSCSQRSLSTQKSRISTSAKVSRSFLVSQDLNFGTTQGRCRKRDKLISLNAICRQFHSSDC
jgi:hypothetical protein